MQKSKLSIFPEPSIDAILIIDGPYKYLRHPMYTSVLLGCLGLVLIQFNLIRLAIFGLLVLNLLFKLHWEETMLKRKFDCYQGYCNTTKKLIPFIY
jgi:protein-S-isoprenylcysteine O-methyltransferase Ste14